MLEAGPDRVSGSRGSRTARVRRYAEALIPGKRAPGSLGDMNRRTVAAPALLILTLALVAPSASAAPTSHRSSTTDRSGQIVWTLAPAGGQNGHLLIARPDGSGQRSLTPDDPNVNDVDAVISPNGKWALFERDSGDSSELRIVATAGGPSRSLGLVCTGSCLADGRPTWLGDDRIAWTRYDGGDQYPNGYAGTLMSARLDDGTVSAIKRLSPDGPDGVFEDAYARLTPDGKYYVFERYSTDTGDVAIFRMRRDRSAVSQLTDFALNVDLPHISPATTGPTAGLVVFQTYGQGNPTGTSRDLATVPVSCASLSACAAATHYVTSNGLGLGRASNPTWSPDGLRIAYAGRPSVDVVDCQIQTIAYDGSDVRTVSTSPLFDYRPDWGRTPGSGATLGG